MHLLAFKVSQVHKMAKNTFPMILLLLEFPPFQHYDL